MNFSKFMTKRNIWLFCGIFSLLITATEFYYIVEPGYTALHLRVGKIISAGTESGMYFKIPLVDSIIMINNRICKAEIGTTALSKDLQSIKADVAINYRINDAIKLYKTVGIDFEKIILNPYSQESIKAVCAMFTAEDLIRIRDKARTEVFNQLKSRLDPIFIELIDFNFVHLDFTAQFIHAVEEKQIAEQLAKTAHNLTEKINEEAIQARTKADAEAYSLNIKRMNLTPDLIRLKAIEKWDGKLPHYQSGSLPMLMLDK